MSVQGPNRLPRRFWTPPVRSIFGTVPVPFFVDAAHADHAPAYVSISIIESTDQGTLWARFDPTSLRRRQYGESSYVVDARAAAPVRGSFLQDGLGRGPEGIVYAQ
jgi:hypothetical protein